MAKPVSLTFSDIISKRLETVTRDFKDAGIPTDSVEQQCLNLASEMDTLFNEYTQENADALESKAQFRSLNRTINKLLVNVSDEKKEEVRQHLVKTLMPKQ